MILWLILSIEGEHVFPPGIKMESVRMYEERQNNAVMKGEYCNKLDLGHTSTQNISK